MLGNGTYAFTCLPDGARTDRPNAPTMMTGKNIGDNVNDAGRTRGWFQAGFEAAGKANGYEVRGATHQNMGGNSVVDYNPPHTKQRQSSIVETGTPTRRTTTTT